MPIQIPNFETPDDKQAFYEEKAKQLGELQAHYALYDGNWDKICEIIVAMENGLIETLLRVEDQAKAAALRGQVMGMRTVRNLKLGIQEQIEEKVAILKALQEE